MLQLSIEDTLRLQAAIKGHKLAKDFKGTDFENVFRLWRRTKEEFIKRYGREAVENFPEARFVFIQSWAMVEKEDKQQ